MHVDKNVRSNKHGGVHGMADPIHIMLKSLCKLYFYVVKLQFTGIYIIFLIFARKQSVDTRLNHFAEAVLTSIHNLCF